MSNSPYAAASTAPGLDEYRPTRTSVMAVLAVVAAILCLPPMGLLAILLGAIALTAIGRSNGRLEGRGAAISGIILGLITTVLWGAVSLGVLQGYTYYTKNMVTTGDRFFQAAGARDYDALRAELTADAAASITDEQLDWFFAEIEAREGNPQGASTSLNTMFNSFGAVFGASRGQNSSPNFQIEQTGNDDVLAPVAVQCANGSVIAWILFEEDSLQNLPASTPKVVDLFVQFANQDVIAMRRGGPASQASGQLQNTNPVTNPDAAPESPAVPDMPGPDAPEHNAPDDAEG